MGPGWKGCGGLEKEARPTSRREGEGQSSISGRPQGSCMLHAPKCRPAMRGGRSRTHLPPTELLTVHHNRLAALALDLNPANPRGRQCCTGPAAAAIRPPRAVRPPRDCTRFGGEFGAGGGAEGPGRFGSGRARIGRRHSLLPGLAPGPRTACAQGEARGRLRRCIADRRMRAPPRHGKAGLSWSGSRLRRAGIGGERRGRTMRRSHGQFGFGETARMVVRLGRRRCGGRRACRRLAD